MFNTPRTRFLVEWLLLLGGLLAVGGVISLTLYRDHGDIERRERDRLATQASVINRNLGSLLHTVDRTLTGIRNDLPGWQKEKDGMAQASLRLRAFADAMRSTRTLLVLDAGGDVIAASRPELIGKNFSQRPYFRTAQERPDPNILLVSPPFQTVLGVWAMNVMRVMTGPHGEFAGIVSATLDPDELRAQLGAVLYGPDMWAALAHGDGLQVLMEPDRPGQSGKDLAQPGSFFSRHLASGKTADVLEGVVAATGEYRMMALHTLRPAEVAVDHPLVIAVGRDMGTLYATWWRQAWLEGGLFLLLVGLSLPALAFAQRRRRMIEEERQQAAEALAESERFMRSLIDIIPGMVGYWDRELRCGFANAAYLDWFGKTPGQMHGIPIQELMGEALFKKNEAFMRAALAGEPQHFERTLIKADGSTGYTWAHYIPDIAAQEVRGFFVLVSDITELKQVQLRLETLNTALEKRSAEAEAASRAKSAFVANMSHEIRTPMNAVLGLLELLEHTTLSERQHDYVCKAEGAARSLLAILNDILDFSKVEAGKLTLDDTPFRLDELLRNLAVVLSASLSDKQIEVLFDIGPGVPRALRGDALRLQQVLLNLAGNAVKFTEHGEVVVSLRLLSADERTASIEFAISDTGIGIPAARLQAVFEAFTQAENSTTRRFGGTGLGLALSQRLVELMGGKLEVESSEGIGSRFHFSVAFQLAEDSVATTCCAPPEQWPPQLAKSLRVLIVDDNATAREVLARLAHSFGWISETVDSGEEAVTRVQAEIARGQAFDLICMDWIMPGLDGWETARMIRAVEHDSRAPAILMVTAQGREVLEARLQDEESPIDDYLVKPVTPSMLFDAVARVTGGKSAQEPNRQTRIAGRPLAGLRLLLVEDNPLNQLVARDLLTHAGASVEVAENGIEAIISVHQQIPDAVLMDIQMPEMDGYEAARALRADGFSVPIIAMTANALPSDREVCLAAGMNDHIAKPIDSREMIAKLLLYCGNTIPANADNALTAEPLPEVSTAIELDAALTRLGGQRELYAELARRFVDDRSLLDDVDSALAQGDTPTAVRSLHTLKGLAATLGIRALAEQAAQAQTEVETGSAAIGDRLARLRELFEATLPPLQEIAEQLAPLPLPDLAPLSTPEQLAQRLRELAQLLDAHDLQALDAYNELVQAAGDTFGDRMEALAQAMHRLDFPTALSLLQQLQEGLSQ